MELQLDLYIREYVGFLPNPNGCKTIRHETITETDLLILMQEKMKRQYNGIEVDSIVVTNINIYPVFAKRRQKQAHLQKPQRHHPLPAGNGGC